MATRLTLGALHHALADPEGLASWLTHRADLWRTEVKVVEGRSLLKIFQVAFGSPPPDLAGYPAEQVRVIVRSDGDIFAVPVGDDARRWLHRYRRVTPTEIVRVPAGVQIPWERLLGALCLWYPRDPAHLRWAWVDGFDAYLRVVQRHLWSEEYWRRHGHWPAEDTPHGERADGRPHPILTAALRSA